MRTSGLRSPCFRCASTYRRPNRCVALSERRWLLDGVGPDREHLRLVTAGSAAPTRSADIEVGFVKAQRAVGVDDRTIRGMVHRANRDGPKSAPARWHAASALSPGRGAGRSENCRHLNEGPVTFRGETQGAEPHHGVPVEQQHLPVRTKAKAREAPLGVLHIREELAPAGDVRRAHLVELVDPVTVGACIAVRGGTPVRAMARSIEPGDGCRWDRVMRAGRPRPASPSLGDASGGPPCEDDRKSI